jgi:hypothetical protein
VILDGVGYGYLNKNQKPSSANVDDNTKAMAKHLAKKVVALLAKAKNPQNKILGEDEDEFFGDDLACDEGTYSLHFSENGSEGEEDDYDVYTENIKLDASFDDCIIKEDGDHEDLWELVEFIMFRDGLVFAQESSGGWTLTLKGTHKLDIELKDKEYYNDWGDAD